MTCLSKADKEVKVEEQGVNQFQLNVTSANEEGKNYLAIIMRALEEKEISFINANMSRSFGFEMEAVIEVTQAMDSSVLTETVIQAIENNGGSN
uniref:Plant bHLH transcription factor ACT-like domain-containing protein n=1 Tax=Chenopodium quinoa TaxID=63459 RepID=A0A803N2R7_CHEQI